MDFGQARLQKWMDSEFANRAWQMQWYALLNEM